MNEYATMAQDHWRRFLPSRYAQILDPDSFFSTLGREVETEIEELAQMLAGDDLIGEDYLAKLGRLTAAKQQAREKVLAERVLLPAEPGSELDETEPDEEVPVSMTTPWSPTTEDPDDPFWRANPTD